MDIRSNHESAAAPFHKYADPGLLLPGPPDCRVPNQLPLKTFRSYEFAESYSKLNFSSAQCEPQQQRFIHLLRLAERESVRLSYFLRLDHFVADAGADSWPARYSAQKY